MADVEGFQAIDRLPPAPPIQKHNFPAQLTSFIGRQRELAEIKSRLIAGLNAPSPNTDAAPALSPEAITHPAPARLLTLTGPGGAGKTRLALQAAADLVEFFKDGLWWIELAALSDPGFIPQAIAEAVGLAEQPGQPPLTRLLDYLSHKQVLLALDNCEHLVEECARICRVLLSELPGLTILTTSRESLGLTGEVNWSVPPLSLPEVIEVGPSEPAEWRQSEAVRLFIERAGAVQPGFAIGPAEWPLLGQLCRRVDGLPLAIELAAARVNMLSLEQLVSRLDDRFRLLASGSRAVLPRHQTLKALVDWSYDLLSPPEQLLFQRFGIFAGGWPLEGAEAVDGWGELDPADILDLQHHLVNKSLVVTKAGLAGRPPRYFLLETLRQYALEKLAASGQEGVVRQRHLAYYLALAEQADRGLRGPQQTAWLERLEAEKDNLRAALAWAFEGPSPLEPALVYARLRLPLALCFYWYIKGYGLEWRNWLDRALAATATEPPSILRSLAYSEAGKAARFQGDFPATLAFGQAGLAMARRLNDKYAEATALLDVAWGLNDHGNREAGSQIYDMLEQSLALYRAVGAKWEIAWVLNHLATIAVMVLDDNALAIRLEEECLALQVEEGDLWGQSGTLAMLANSYCALGQYEQAQACFDRCTTNLSNTDTPPHALSIYRNLGMAARFQGQPVEAARLLRQSLEFIQSGQLPAKHQIAGLVGNLAFVEIELGHYRSAWDLLARSFRAHQALHIPGGAAWNLEGLAFLALATRQPELSAFLFGSAEAGRELAKSPMLHNDRAFYRQKTDLLKKNLPPTILNARWAAGRAASLEEAFAAAERSFNSNSPELTDLDGIPAVPLPVTAPSASLPQPESGLAELTARELDVLRLVAQGMTNPQVAQALVLSPLTVNGYLRSIYSKLNVTTRTAAARLALENRLV